MVQPCVGVRREDLDAQAAQGFSSVAHDAWRTLDNADEAVVEGLQWRTRVVKRFPVGEQGSVGNPG